MEGGERVEAGLRQRCEAVKCRRKRRREDEEGSEEEEWETGLNEDLALVGRVSRRRLVSHPSP